MLVPDELAARLDELELPAVRLRDDLGRPVLGEATELLRDVDWPAASTSRDRLECSVMFVNLSEASGDLADAYVRVPYT